MDRNERLGRFDPHLLKVPERFTRSGDPISENPFPPDTANYRAWADATKRAEVMIYALNAKRLSAPLNDSETIAFVCERFDIWAWRAICIASGPVGVRSYDRWLKDYAEAWLSDCASTDHLSRQSVQDAQGFLRELRIALIARIQHWMAEARRLNVEREAAATTQPMLETRAIVLASGQSQPLERAAQQTRLLNRAAWLKQKMASSITTYRIHAEGGPDKKTIDRILRGERVQSATVDKLAKALRVSRQDIPDD